jgi:hypothetical protein
MGFLDNSTNNIKIDVVLTDMGRQLLSRNDGSFSIHKFALGDDEVDYSIIQQFGITLGKEKIEKNTPIMEALTNQTYALKHKLVSVSNPNLIRLPELSLSGDSNVSSSDSVVSLGKTTQKTSNITIEQTIKNETTIDVELRDQTFLVELSDLFLQVLKFSPDKVDRNGRAIYLLTRSANENAIHGSILQFSLSVKSLSNSDFTVYGNTANKNIISTYVKITGLQSGAVKEFKVNINKSL